MKEQIQNQIEVIQRDIELINQSALTHSQKRGALELVSLNLDELALLVDNRIYEHARKVASQHTLLELLIKEAASFLGEIVRDMKYQSYNKDLLFKIEEKQKKFKGLLRRKHNPYDEDIPF